MTIKTQQQFKTAFKSVPVIKIVHFTKTMKECLDNTYSTKMPLQPIKDAIQYTSYN